MAVEEVIELERTLSSQGIAPLGAGIINRYGPHILSASDGRLLSATPMTADAAINDMLQVGRWHQQREANERQLRAQIAQQSHLPWFELPNLHQPVRSIEQLENLGNRLWHTQQQQGSDALD
jgi:hypothetical protein